MRGELTGAILYWWLSLALVLPSATSTNPCRCLPHRLRPPATQVACGLDIVRERSGARDWVNQVLLVRSRRLWRKRWRMTGTAMVWSRTAVSLTKPTTRGLFPAPGWYGEQQARAREGGTVGRLWPSNPGPSHHWADSENTTRCRIATWGASVWPGFDFQAIEMVWTFSFQSRNEVSKDSNFPRVRNTIYRLLVTVIIGQWWCIMSRLDVALPFLNLPRVCWMMGQWSVRQRSSSSYSYQLFMMLVS